MMPGKKAIIDEMTNLILIGTQKQVILDPKTEQVVDVRDVWINPTAKQLYDQWSEALEEIIMQEYMSKDATMRERQREAELRAKV